MEFVVNKTEAKLTPKVLVQKRTVNPNVKSLVDAQEVNGVLCVNTGAICKYLGCIINKDFITKTLGIEPYAKIGIAGLWTIEQFQDICTEFEEYLSEKRGRLG